jgi:hypothetical protein
VKPETARPYRQRLPNGIVMEAPDLLVGKLLDVAWSLLKAFTGEL